MPWICPKCNRTFSTINKDHSCLSLGPDHHFEGKPGKIKEIFDLILSIPEFGEVQTSFVKHAIIISARSSFLALKPKRQYMEVEIVLNEESSGFPVYKIVRASKNKYAHFVKIEDPDEVDEIFKNLLIKALQENTFKV